MFSLSTLCATTWVNWLVDIVAILIFLVVIFICQRIGFSAFFSSSISSLFFCSILPLILCGPVLLLTNNLFGLQDLLSNGFESALLNLNGFDVDLSTANLEEALKAQNLPAFTINSIVNTYDGQTFEVGTTLAHVVAQSFASNTVSIITLIVLMVVIIIAYIFLSDAIKNFASSLAFGQAVDQFLGMIVGIFLGVVVCYSLLSIITLIPSPSLLTFFNDCVIIGFMYDYNLVSMFLGLFS